MLLVEITQVVLKFIKLTVFIPAFVQAFKQLDTIEITRITRKGSGKLLWFTADPGSLHLYITYVRPRVHCDFAPLTHRPRAFVTSRYYTFPAFTPSLRE